jgi:hypothetical protein
MTPPDVLDAARADARRHPPAMSGQGGHTTAFVLAVRLVHHWCLSGSEALAVLREWNVGCLPPWSERELQHKVDSALRSGKSGAPAGCLAERVRQRRGGGAGAFERWRKTPFPSARTARTVEAKLVEPGASDGSDDQRRVLVRVEKKLDSYAKGLERPSEASVNHAFPLLVPLVAPWTDGARYRQAQATEWPSRLDLYLEDSSGPWIRRHGVLVAVR